MVYLRDKMPLLHRNAQRVRGMNRISPSAEVSRR